MRPSILIVFFLLTFLSSLSLGQTKQELEKDYLTALALYYQISDSEISDLLKLKLELEDLPVLVFIAKKTKITPEKIAKFREQGDSWQDIIKMRTLDPGIFYIMITGEIKSKIYNLILTKFKTIPESNWKKIQLTDDEIINLVNLRFICSHHDYTVYDVMAMREYGKDFAGINYQVALNKKEMIKKEKADLKKKKESDKESDKESEKGE